MLHFQRIVILFNSSSIFTKNLLIKNPFVFLNLALKAQYIIASGNARGYNIPRNGRAEGAA